METIEHSEIIMKKLTKTAINILGESGQIWIDMLPEMIKILSNQWQLKNISPVDNMSYNYVAKAIRDNHCPVVLKIGFDEKVMLDEKQALSYFNGNAAIRLIDYDDKYNALLLEQAIPGITLKSFYPMQEQFVIDCYIDTVHRLLNQSTHNADQFLHIKDWLKAIDKMQTDKIPKNLLGKAMQLKNSLLDTMQQEVVLHGDLHHDNILKHNDSWVVIDPKGIRGEITFEIAAFDFIHADEMPDSNNIKKLFDKRLNLISKKSQLSIERIKAWVFVRLILSAVWSVEENDDPSRAIKLAEALY